MAQHDEVPAELADLTMTRSGRDPAVVAERLRGWWAERFPGAAPPTVRVIGGVDASGMSSDTLLLDITRAGPGGPITEEWVARIAPRPEDVPIFRDYRLDLQYAVLRAVGAATAVPVPPLGPLEPTGDVLGTPFFLMRRVEGLVPPDVLPYTFAGNWVFDAEPADRTRLQSASVAVLAELHALSDPLGRFPDLVAGPGTSDGPDSLLRRHLRWCRDWYEFGADAVGRSALTERAFDWLERHWPAEAEAAPPVLCWGDARIGNIIYRDFVPVAVLDWEMATIGPRELDVAWMILAHQVFQTLTEAAGLPGLPDLLTRDDVVRRYTELTGVPPRQLRWFEVYAAVMWSCVFLRTGARQVHFGERPRPADPDELFYHRELLAQLISEGDAR